MTLTPLRPAPAAPDEGGGDGLKLARDALFQREVQGLDTGQTCIYPLVDPPTTSAEHKFGSPLLVLSFFLSKL